MSQDLDALMTAVSLLGMRTLRDHRNAVKAEADIRDSIEQVDVMRRAAASGDQTSQASRQVGADALWQGWLIGRRTALLQQSALARARLNESRVRAKTAFARETAVEALLEQERQRIRQQKQARADNELAALMLMRRNDDGA